MLTPVNPAMISDLRRLMFGEKAEYAMTPEELHAMVAAAVTPDCDVQVDWSLRSHACSRHPGDTRSVDVTVVSGDLRRVVASGETCAQAWEAFCRQWSLIQVQESVGLIDVEVA